MTTPYKLTSLTTTLLGVRNGNDVACYLDGELVTQTSMEELEAYLQTHA